MLRVARLDQSAGGRATYALVAVAFMISSALAGVLFIQAAERVSLEMRNLLENKALHHVAKREVMAQVCRMLYVNGVMRILTTLAFLWFLVEVVLGVDSVVRYGVAMFYFTAVRLVVADRHIDAIHSRMEPSTLMYLVREAREWKTRATSVAPELHEENVAQDSFIFSTDVPVQQKEQLQQAQLIQMPTRPQHSASSETGGGAAEPGPYIIESDEAAK